MTLTGTLTVSDLCYFQIFIRIINIHVMVDIADEIDNDRNDRLVDLKDFIYLRFYVCLFYSLLNNLIILLLNEYI